MSLLGLSPLSGRPRTPRGRQLLLPQPSKTLGRSWLEASPKAAGGTDVPRCHVRRLQPAGPGGRLGRREHVGRRLQASAGALGASGFVLGRPRPARGDGNGRGEPPQAGVAAAPSLGPARPGPHPGLPAPGEASGDRWQWTKGRVRVGWTKGWLSPLLPLRDPSRPPRGAGT